MKHSSPTKQLRFILYWFLTGLQKQTFLEPVNTRKNQVYKKANLISFGIILFSLFYSFGVISQTLVSTDIEKKTPVIYDFTGIHCVSCPHAHEAIAVSKAHYPQVVALSFHTGNFAAPNSGEPDFRTAEGDFVVDHFAYWEEESELYRVVWSYPTVCIDGDGVENGVVTDTTQFLEQISEVTNQDATVNIGAIASIDTIQRKLKVRVECYYTSSSADSNYLIVSLTQNGLKSAQSGVPQAGDEYVHKEMFRMFVSNIWGDTLGIPQEGDLIEKTYFMDLPDSINYSDSAGVELVLQNIQIQAFITGSDTIVTAYDFLNIPYKNRRAFDILNGVNADIEFVNLNSISTNVKEQLFTMYPNPATDFINIRLSQQILNEQQFILEILDVNGRILKTQSLSDTDGNNTFQIPAQGLKKGIYFIRLKGKNLIETKKLVLE